MKPTWPLVALLSCVFAIACQRAPLEDPPARVAADKTLAGAKKRARSSNPTSASKPPGLSVGKLEDIPDSELRVVSLRSLQAELRPSSPRAEKLKRPQAAERMFGLTQVLGYVIDERNDDLLLYGRTEPGRPAVRTDDFVVALRNVWLKYAERRNNTIYIEHPGCSIDPDPSVMRELQRIFDGIERTQDPDRSRLGFEHWLEVARSPQQVRVLGVPFATHFAKVTVDADYYMKRLTDGSETIDILGWVSLVDLRINEAKKQLAGGGKVTVPAASMDRFWFCSGETRYAQDDGIILITKNDVALLTEQEHVSGSGHLSGTGRQDPYAEKFAGNFTRLYPAVAMKENRYWELGELFRLVTLATILKECGLERHLQFLLEDYEVPAVAVEPTVDGVANMRTLEHTRDVKGGTETMTMWFCSCGGVEIAPEPRAEAGDPRKRDWMTRAKRSMLAQRPLSAAAYWSLSAGSVNGAAP